ncbi:MAG: DUF3320 domain-containing protein [Thermomicrobiales bacterium]|nr:DUF3320 domain-containing protein [Thermomicrobiales bacterium]
MVADSSPAQPTSVVQDRLELARRELLDLGLRNFLINYRTLKARGVEVVDEDAAEVFRILVTDGKRMSFAPGAESDASSDALPQPADETPDQISKRQKDTILQTAVSPEELQTRLLTTFYAARTFIEEQGVNTLFVALGMLTWFETQTSDTPRKAPLLLVPVDIQRSNARERFTIGWTGDDIGDNLSLAAKLSVDFRLTAPPLPEVEDLDLNAYFAAWQEAIAAESRWSIDGGSVVVGFFSFGRFLMYHDLDVSTWPDTGGLADHEIIVPLLTDDGFKDSAPAIADDAFIDPLLPVDKAREVMDADSTQTLAILDVNGGQNLVIQGPPGTGKSQTITNVISEAIGQGKTVLFVAEKLAALEVVKRRLDSIGLGDACLELHSNKMNKRIVLSELARTLELGKPQLATDADNQVTLLAEQRQRLNDYARAVNDPIGESGVSPYQTYGELLRLAKLRGDATWPRFDQASMADWDAAAATRRDEVVAELQARIAAMGRPADHPFWGSHKSVVLPSEREQIAAQVPGASSALDALRNDQRTLAQALSMPEPMTLQDADEQLAAANRLLAAPDLTGVAIDAPEWSARRDDVRGLIDTGQAYAEIRQRQSATLIPEAWTADVLETRQTLNGWRGKWWRFISGGYRGAKSKLAGLVQGGLPDGIDAQVALLDDILAAKRDAETIDAQAGLGKQLFAERWQGAASDWAALSPAAEWVSALHADEAAGKLPSGTVALAATRPDLAPIRAAAAAVQQCRSDWDSRIAALTKLLDFDASRRFGAGATLESQSFDTIRWMLSGWQDRLGDLDQMVSFNRSAEACAQEDMAGVAEAAAGWDEAGTRLGDAVRAGRFAVLLERAIRERPPLAQFDAPAHNLAVSRFGELDQLTFQLNRARLALNHWERLPRYEAGGQLGILRREFAKKTRHMPVRQLMSRAGNAIQAIKPVFMMSPLSIPTYIPPGTLKFDLVIFDEASQVKPVDAFGALVRGKQAVVVGDSKQLPPTSFFDTLIERDDVDEDDLTANTESILEMFAGQGARQRMLRWHYRSQHESLIAVSNSEFYDNKLVVFPSPDADRHDAGLIYHYLADTSYDRGGSRTNRDEAHAVAEAVMEHARTTPDLTLGVAAFSLSQTDAIIDELERLRREDDSGESFFADHPFEPFFVKNLENVQGDERDVIFISVGYGKTADGSLAMNFGPLNAEGGERRLNVLITRAKQRCEVFTNLSADDIDLSRTSARGVHALKEFLRFAEKGTTQTASSSVSSEAPFDAVVRAALEEAGYEIEPHVGSSGFYIDLAVKDPAQPGRYLMAILCDGPTYAAARSSRDRDRSRRSVLQRLGWRVYQLWSTDWFRSPERELQDLIAEIEAARTGVESEVAPMVQLGPVSRVEAAPEAEEQSTSTMPAYVVAKPKVSLRGKDLHEVQTERMADWFAEVVAVESPVHIDVAMRRVADAAGSGRIGNRIQMSMNNAVAAAVRDGKIRRQGDFLWAPNMTEATVRNRVGLPSRDRSLDMIAPEELHRAVLTAVADSYGLQEEDVTTATANLLGFGRASTEMRASINALVEAMIADGSLRRQGAFLVADKPSNSG